MLSILVFALSLNLLYGQTTLYAVVNIPNVDQTAGKILFDAEFAKYQTTNCMPTNTYKFSIFYPPIIEITDTLEDYNKLYDFLTTEKTNFITYTGQPNIWVDNIIPDPSAVTIKSFGSILYDKQMKDLFYERIAVANFLLKTSGEDNNINVLYIIELDYYKKFSQPGVNFDPLESLGTTQGFLGQYYITAGDNLDELIQQINARSPNSFVLMASQPMVKTVLDKLVQKNFLRPPYLWIVMSAGLTRTDLSYASLSGSFFSVEFGLDDASKADMIKAGFTTLNDEEILLHDMAVLARSHAQNKLCQNDFSFTVLSLNSGNYNIGTLDLGIVRNYNVYRGLGPSASVLGKISYTPNIPEDTITTDINKVDLTQVPTEEQLLSYLQQTGWKVAVINDPPYVFKYENGTDAGIIVDYINLLFNSLNTKVEFIYVNSDDWNSTRALIDTNEVDMTGDPTIPVDVNPKYHVSAPIMSTAFMMIYQDTDMAPIKKLFRFTVPFAWETWITLLFACIAVSLTLFVLDKISPNMDRIDITEAFYFGFGAVLHAAGFTPPTRLSSRLLYISWFMLSLIIIVCYGGAYGAYYTSLAIAPSLKNPTQLLSQNKYEFGLKNDSNLIKILRLSIIPEQKKLYTIATEVYKPVVTNAEAIDKINNGNFVFIAPAEVAIHLKNQFCYQISQKFYPAFYSLLGNVNNPYNSLVDAQIVKFTRENAITPILNKYVPNVFGSDDNCVSNLPLYATWSALGRPLLAYASRSIPIADLAGFYLVVIIGLAVSLIILMIEGIIKLVNYKKQAKEQKD